MAFAPGHPKYGGRQKGTPNKSTTAARKLALATLVSLAHALAAPVFCSEMVWTESRRRSARSASVGTSASIRSGYERRLICIILHLHIYRYILRRPVGSQPHRS
jgi:hypothetical protein